MLLFWFQYQHVVGNNVSIMLFKCVQICQWMLSIRVKACPDDSAVVCRSWCRCWFCTAGCLALGPCSAGEGQYLSNNRAANSPIRDERASMRTIKGPHCRGPLLWETAVCRHTLNWRLISTNKYEDRTVLWVLSINKKCCPYPTWA